MAVREQTELNKINILKKETLDSLDLSQHVGEIFGTTDDMECNYTQEEKDKLAQLKVEANNFAESERLKSKNLFNPNGMTIGQSTYGYFYIGNADTYTISLRDNDTSVGISGIYLGFTDTGKDSSGQTPDWIIANNYINPDYILTNSTQKYISFYPNDTETLNKLIQRFNIQVEEGSTATPYVEYQGGKIVREEQLQQGQKGKIDVATANSISLDNQSFSNLTEMVDYMLSKPYVSFECGIGNSNDNSVKSLVGNPEGFANYTTMKIVKICTSWAGDTDKRGTIYKCYALADIVDKLAEGYIFCGGNPANEPKFTGWKILY